MILALFDFDGTISTRDTTMDFMAQTFGDKKSRWSVYRLVFHVILHMLRLMSLQRVKESYLEFFIKGYDHHEFREKVDEFTKTFMPRTIIPGAVDRIQWHKNQGHEVAVVSGSNDVFLQPFCEEHGITLITNTLEVKDGKLTGKLNENYCYGKGKVELIKQRYNLDQANYIYAYGNSRGDREMMALADEAFYQPFTPGKQGRQIL